MKKPSYYSLKLYGIGEFPKFYDSFKNMETINRWLKMAKDDGYKLAEIYREKPGVRCYFGVVRELIKTVELSK